MSSSSSSSSTSSWPEEQKQPEGLEEELQPSLDEGEADVGGGGGGGGGEVAGGTTSSTLEEEEPDNDDCGGAGLFGSSAVTTSTLWSGVGDFNADDDDPDEDDDDEGDDDFNGYHDESYDVERGVKGQISALETDLGDYDDDEQSSDMMVTDDTGTDEVDTQDELDTSNDEGLLDYPQHHYRLHLDEEEEEEEDHREEHHDVISPLGDDDIELGLQMLADDQLLSAAQATIRTSPCERESTVTDISTGKQGGARLHHAHLRSISSKEPCAQKARFRHRVFGNVAKKFNSKRRPATTTNTNYELEVNEERLKSSVHGRLRVSARTYERENEIVGGGVGGNEPVNNIIDNNRQSVRQYRLQAVAPPPKRCSIMGCISWMSQEDLGHSHHSASAFHDDAAVAKSKSAGLGLCCCCCGPDPNLILIRYLHWTFRSSFAAVFLSFACWWFVMITLFALGIWSIGKRHPTCIGGSDFKPEYFVDAWELSWTTLSTVGYGLVYSGISTTEPNIGKCTGITILVVFEAFVGILFASMCGAIMVAKVARIQSYAQVQFSDVIVIRYGHGALHHDDAGDDDSTQGSEDVERNPCPVLEFRLINRLAGTHGGEIIDASITCVASIDASQACPTLKNATRRRRRGKKGKKGGRRGGPIQTNPVRRRSHVPTGISTIPENGTGRMPQVDSSESLASLADALAKSQLNKTHQSFEEDPTGHLVSNKIFSKLEVETPDHPFFKRVWVIRHTLDENSPLLRHYARQMVKRNGGYWPRELNDHDGVRSAILFDQILVSMSGTSNADANSVYAQHMYHFSCVNVGYRFCNILYRDPVDDSLQVDSRLLNDVTEQAGGGGEQFKFSMRHLDKATDQMEIL